jgi:hypothetical protein
MKTILRTTAVCGLAITIIPSILYFAWTLDLPRSQQFMTLGMLLWFAGDIPRVIGRHKRQ